MRPGTFAFRIARNGSAAAFEIEGNRVTEQLATLRDLMMDAYNIKDYQISGLPDWGARGNNVYDLDARTDSDSPTVAQVRLMVQALLAERFQLTLHRESRDLPVYELVIGKNGSKLKQTIPDDSPGQPSSERIRAVPSKTMTTPVPMLIDLLSNLVDRPIIDKTGLTATYEYENLDWAGIRRSQSAAADTGEPTESVFTAVQEKLGLKLEPAKASTEVLVIEHVTRPSAN
jgi:uncharacterized protein (TIGR03435 family)